MDAAESCNERALIFSAAIFKVSQYCPEFSERTGECPDGVDEHAGSKGRSNLCAGLKSMLGPTFFTASTTNFAISSPPIASKPARSTTRRRRFPHHACIAMRFSTINRTQPARCIANDARRERTIITAIRPEIPPRASEPRPAGPGGGTSLDEYPESLDRETWLHPLLINDALGPDKGAGLFVVVGDEAIDMGDECTLPNDPPLSDFPDRMENHISIWFNQDVCVGV